MKIISYLINVILLVISIFFGIKLYEKDNKVEVVKKYYYECSIKTEMGVYTEVSNYRIDINNDYSIKDLETSITYLYDKYSFESARDGYLLSNKNVVIDEENYSIKVPGDNLSLSENMWAITFIEQLENNNYVCTLKND